MSPSKYQYLESYDIKRDFHDFKFYNLVQSKKHPQIWNKMTVRKLQKT